MSIAAIAVFFAAWQLSSYFLPPIYISTPAAVARAFVQVIPNGLLSAFLTSLADLFIGFGVACLIGITVGMMMGRIRLLERALEPYVALGNAAPIIVLLPLIEVWLGIGNIGRLAFIVVIGVWAMIVNTLMGVRSVRRTYADVGRAFDLSPMKAVWTIYLPAAMPFVLVGARISLAQCTVGTILAGQEIGESGLGGLAETYAGYSQTAELIATVVSSTCLALIGFWLLHVLRERFFPWITATARS